MKYFFLYICTINIIGFLTMAVDKYKSAHNKWRIKESTLFAIALFGGALGVKIAMNTFRHKTKHKSFIIGIPALIIVNIIIYAIFLYYMVF